MKTELKGSQYRTELENLKEEAFDTLGRTERFSQVSGYNSSNTTCCLLASQPAVISSSDCFT